MTSSRDRRIAKELADMQADKDHSGVFAVPIDGSTLTRLRGTISAPPETPYTGGIYNIDIEIPENYPFKSPVMRFDTRIWHPNVSSVTGLICLDTLSSAWSPVQTIKTALISIRLLLEYPNYKDPQDAQVASMLRFEPAKFASTARTWAVHFAGAPEQDVDMNVWLKKHLQTTEPPAKEDANALKGYNKDLVNRFVNMGFDQPAIVSAFLHVGISRNNGEDYQLGDASVGDVIAFLLGER